VSASIYLRMADTTVHTAICISSRVTIEAFTWVNTMIGNVRNSMLGTYHAINHKHLPRYLAEFCYPSTGVSNYKTCWID